MNRKQMVDEIDRILRLHGFGKAGRSKWQRSSEATHAAVELSKSNFSNLNELRFRLTLKSIPLDEDCDSHVCLSAIGQSPVERKFIADTLDIDSSLSDTERAKRLHSVITEHCLKLIEATSTEQGLKVFLEANLFLMVTPNLLDHFGLQQKFKEELDRVRAMNRS